MDLLVPLAEAKGLVRVADARTRRPGVLVARADVPVEALEAFLRAWNRAVDRINSQPEPYLRQAGAEFLSALPPELQVSLEVLLDRLGRWRFSRVRPYRPEDFDGAYGWMLERGLAPAGLRFDQAVIPTGAGTG
jgi:hypothetical protein